MRAVQRHRPSILLSIPVSAAIVRVSRLFSAVGKTAEKSRRREFCLNFSRTAPTAHDRCCVRYSQPLLIELIIIGWGRALRGGRRIDDRGRECYTRLAHANRRERAASAGTKQEEMLICDSMGRGEKISAREPAGRTAAAGCPTLCTVRRVVFWP